MLEEIQAQPLTGTDFLRRPQHDFPLFLVQLNFHVRVTVLSQHAEDGMKESHTV